MVVETPNMRAIELISTSNRYCSSVFSHGPEDDERFLSSGAEMALRNGTSSAKAAPVLIGFLSIFMIFMFLSFREGYHS